jgi:hypothetical protein
LICRFETFREGKYYQAENIESQIYVDDAAAWGKADTAATVNGRLTTVIGVRVPNFREQHLSNEPKRLPDQQRRMTAYFILTFFYLDRTHKK